MKYLQIVLPAIVCLLIAYFTKTSIWYYPLSFGLVIGLVNWSSHKNNPLLGTLLVVLVSYASFFASYFGVGFVAYLLDFMKGDEGALLALSIAPNIISPLLLFILFHFIFKIKKNKLRIFVILFSIIFLFFYSYIPISLEWYYLHDNRLLNPSVIWQVIMALAIQILIHQNLFSLKKDK